LPVGGSWGSRAAVTALLCLGVVPAARAVDVEVVKSGAFKSSIDLSGLRGNDAAASLFRKTLGDDLVRSGWFVLTGPARAVVAVSGTCVRSAGSVTSRCVARNTATGGTFLNRTFRDERDRVRRLAHTVADEIVRSVKGVPGIASTRIAMVGRRGAGKDIYLCDTDGHNVVQLTRDGAVCLAPAWCPGGDLLFYTSLLKGFPDVYRIDLRTHARERVAGFPGLNAGADVSPDGRSLVLTLSKDGNPELYILGLGSRRVSRLTRTRMAAEASPSWAPDGNRVVFVSDRSGSPQLYATGRDGSGYRRLSFRGSENVAPDWGPDGRIAYSSRREGRYELCVLDPSAGTDTRITRGDADYEEPSWAPDSRHIVCTRTAGYHSDLYILDTLGDAPLRLTSLGGDWYSPAWSPQ